MGSHVEEHPMKILNVDEEDKQKPVVDGKKPFKRRPMFRTYNSNNPPSPYNSDDEYESEEQMHECHIYRAQYYASDGYDITVFPSGNLMGIFRPVEHDGTFGEVCKQGANLAVEEENEKGANLKFVDVLRANMYPFTNYLITLRAQDTISQEIRTYRTKIHQSPGQPMEVLSFKLREADNE